MTCRWSSASSLFLEPVRAVFDGFSRSVFARHSSFLFRRWRYVKSTEVNNAFAIYLPGGLRLAYCVAVRIIRNWLRAIVKSSSQVIGGFSVLMSAVTTQHFHWSPCRQVNEFRISVYSPLLFVSNRALRVLVVTVPINVILQMCFRRNLFVLKT